MSPIDYAALQRAQDEHKANTAPIETPEPEKLRKSPQFNKPKAAQGSWSIKLTQLRARRQRIERISNENDARIANAIREAKTAGATLRQIAPILDVSAQGVNHILATDEKRQASKAWKR